MTKQVCDVSTLPLGIDAQSTKKLTALLSPPYTTISNTDALQKSIEGNTFFRTIPHRALLKAVLPVKLNETNVTLKMAGVTRAKATLACLNRFLVAQVGCCSRKSQGCRELLLSCKARSQNLLYPPLPPVVHSSNCDPDRGHSVHG